MTRRTERIAEQLRGEIARILREEVTDPRIDLVTLTRVDVAPDLTGALVFWSTLSGDDPARIESIDAGLASAAGFVRSRLAHVLPTKRTPALDFRYDPSLAAGSDILALLRNLSDGAEG